MPRGDLTRVWQATDNMQTSSTPDSADRTFTDDGNDIPGNALQAPQQHIPRRRRVQRACDRCRRQKIKCDGGHPCQHCVEYNHECAYQEQSTRRRKRASQNVQALEERLRHAEAFIQALTSNAATGGLPQHPHAEEVGCALGEQEMKAKSPPGDLGLETVEDDSDPSSDEVTVEFLDSDDQGYRNYYGQSSGLNYMRRLKGQLGAMNLIEPVSSVHPSIDMRLRGEKIGFSGPSRNTLLAVAELPTQEVARRLCFNAIEHACTVMRFVHEPTFFASLDRIYEVTPSGYTKHDELFLPFLYAVMALGCVGVDDGLSPLSSGLDHAMNKGLFFLNIARRMLDVTTSRDLMSLQAIVIIMILLQSVKNSNECYVWVGIALRIAIQLGLHRKVSTKHSNIIDREVQKRVFWVIRKMDIYASTFLGTPQMLNEEDIDQEYPLDLDGAFITTERILDPPAGYTSLMSGCNAHTRLSNILLKAVKCKLWPKTIKDCPSDQNDVLYSRVREIERDLQIWTESLPPALRFAETEASPQLDRVRHQLRISFAHVQMFLYRPFLHRATEIKQQNIDKRLFACAAACISVARNNVRIVAEMQKRNLLNGAYWFTTCAAYYATIYLIYFVVESATSPSARIGILRDATVGKVTLARLARTSLAADRCTQCLNRIFKELPHILERKAQSSSSQNEVQSSLPPETAPLADPPSEINNQFLGNDASLGFNNSGPFEKEFEATPKPAPIDALFQYPREGVYDLDHDWLQDDHLNAEPLQSMLESMDTITESAGNPGYSWPTPEQEMTETFEFSQNPIADTQRLGSNTYAGMELTNQLDISIGLGFPEDLSFEESIDAPPINDSFGWPRWWNDPI